MVHGTLLEPISSSPWLYLKDFLKVYFATGCDFKRWQLLKASQNNTVKTGPSWVPCQDTSTRCRLSGEDEWERWTDDELCMHRRLKYRNKAPFSPHQQKSEVLSLLKGYIWPWHTVIIMWMHKHIVNACSCHGTMVRVSSVHVTYYCMVEY